MTSGTDGSDHRPVPPPVGIVVIAYEASSTITEVLDRIPTLVAGRAPAVLVSDDASTDTTAQVAREWVRSSGRDKVLVVRQERNLGYGGNQVAGYRWAQQHGFTAVVSLHGDGQYPPEAIPALVAPLLEGRADAVFGSRMTDRRGARDGGMPLSRRIGNRALSSVQNALTGASLTEWHSGLRAYRTSVLADLDLHTLPTGFDFDTAITLRILSNGGRLEEIPIPTRYADEVSYIDPWSTGLRILARTVRYRFGGA
jgi:glycosyltransferase involved in cell wall biosynthesis